jgi:glycosyltransferase involved in cell wall biosynthesis
MLSLGMLWKPLKHDLDVVHGHLGTPPGAFAALAYSKARLKPLITTIHTTYNGVSLEGGSSARRLSILLFMNGFCSPLLTSSDTITAVSDSVMQDSPTYQGHVPKTTIIPNGVDLEKLRSDQTREECRRLLDVGPRSHVVLYVGSLSTYKDPRTLLSAFARLASKDPEPYLIMIGDGPLREELLNESKRLGISDRVRLPGFVSEEEKLRYYQAADVFAIPSLGDAFGLVVLEAAAFGLPIVASDLDVFKTLIKDGHDGLIFQRGNEEDLYSKLEMLLQNDEKRAAIGVEARKTAERYGWDTILSEYEALYRGMIRKKSK